MTIRKIVKFVIQTLVYTLAALLAGLPWWQFMGVLILIIIADRIGQVE